MSFVFDYLSSIFCFHDARHLFLFSCLLNGFDWILRPLILLFLAETFTVVLQVLKETFGVLSSLSDSFYCAFTFGSFRLVALVFETIMVLCS